MAVNTGASAQSESAMSLALADGKRVHGLLRNDDSRSPVVLLLHGLTGHMNEHLHFIGARELQRLGYTTFRFNFYGAAGGSRRLVDCTVSTHASDLAEVIRHFRRDAPGRPVVVVGHSLGGLTALLCDEPFDGLVLWDATHGSSIAVLDDVELVRELGLLRWRQRVDHLLNPSMLDEIKVVDYDGLMAQVKAPALIVAAAEGDRPDVGRRYLEASSGDCELQVIDGSDHVFSAGESLDRLLAVTGEWLQRHFPVSEIG